MTESTNSGTVSVDDHSTNTVTSRDINISEVDFKDPASQLRDIKFKNINNPILAYINVNSIRNKLSDLFSIIDSNVEIVLQKQNSTVLFLVHSLLLMGIVHHIGKIGMQTVVDY